MRMLAFAAALVALSAPVLAHAQPVDETRPAVVAVHYGDLDLNRASGAAALLRRIGRASLEACGASEFSLTEYKAVVRDSDCYQSSMQQAIVSIDAPAVTRLYNRHTAQVRVGTR